MPGLYFHITAVDNVQLAFAHRTAGTLLHIINDTRFQELVQNGNYTGRRFRLDGSPARYIQANNTRILNQILTGKEWNVPADGNVNLKLTLGPTNPGAIGYVRPPSPLITTNPAFYNRCMNNNSPVSLAAHWMHEWMHVSGFRHRRGGAVDRNDVPYKIGSFVVQVARAQAAVENHPQAYINAIGQEYLDAYKEQFDCVEEGQK